MPRPTAILFDFDYTLADSSPGIIACTNHALHQLGYPGTGDDAVRTTIGLPLEEMFRRFTGCEDPQQAAEFRRLYVDHADRVMLDSTSLYNGVPELVSGLAGRGVRLAVVTTKYTWRVEQVLERDGLDGHFLSIIGSEKVQHPKPHPESVLLALQELAVPATEALLVGDSPSDAGAAAAAGVPFLAVLTGTTTAADLAAFPVLDHLPHVCRLTAWLATEQQ